LFLTETSLRDAQHYDCQSSSSSSSAQHGHRVPFSRLQHFREEVVKLNRQGMELYRLKKYQSSLFYFNEAFRLVVSTGSQLLDSNINLEETHDMVHSHNGALFRQQPSPPRDFMQPRDLSDSGLPNSMADVETWIIIASLKLMINGALGQLALDKPENARRLLGVALNLSEDDECEEDSTNDALDEDEDQTLRHKYHVQMVLLTVHFLMGHVKEKVFKSTKSQTLTSTSVQWMEEDQLRSCIESKAESLSLSEDLLGEDHWTTAGIYTSIGQLLMREGVTRGASLAFQNADRIYNKPRIVASLEEGGAVQGDMINSKMTDLAFSSIMLGNTRWSFGAAMA
jgi:hypothetical protein